MRQEKSEKILADRLGTLMNELGSDKAKIGYHNIYAQCLEPYRHRKINMLEMGVHQGASLQAWARYMPKAFIVGIDAINRLKQGVIGPRMAMHVGLQEDFEFLNRVSHKYGGFDIIIDDCGHQWRPQQLALETLWPHLRRGGLYIIEDLGTSYRPEWRGDAKINTMDFLHKYVEYAVQDADRVGELEHVQFFSNMCILKKSRIGTGFINRWKE